jgi:telomerase reverse transcriptase
MGMSKKRKRADTDTARRCHSKRQDTHGTHDKTHTKSPVLNSCYPQVLTLREYFVASLPAASRVRRRRLEAWKDPETTTTSTTLLDTCLVGVLSHPSPEVQQERACNFVTFTQTQSSANQCHTAQGPICSIQDVVDFVIWLLFRKCPLTSNRPRHLLCNGLQKGNPLPGQVADSNGVFAISGNFQQHPNEGYNLLRKQPWEQYAALLGADGESIISSLLLDCGLFLRIDEGCDNYLQISGIPISDLNTHSSKGTNGSSATALRKLSDVTFARNRILYAKAPLNKKGVVHFGLKHVHVLQRYPRVDSADDTFHVMKHIFPRQFGLTNVFASPKGQQSGSFKAPDFTYREEEVSTAAKGARTRVPRRLRGAPNALVSRFRKRHARCSYTQLLRYHCPTGVRGQPNVDYVVTTEAAASSASTALNTQPLFSTKSQRQDLASHPSADTTRSFLPHSTPAPNVSAFCKAVLQRVLPGDVLGTGDDGKHNWKMFLRSVDRFVVLRRFETMTLAQVCQDLRIKCIGWMRPPHSHASSAMSRTDYNKRLEILQELMYYIFDSLLIPLLRSNFYITESGVHRNKLFFFRHDVWRRLSEPSLAFLRLNLYKPMKPSEVRKTFESRSLGYSNVRLLPKAEGARPITNLKRRMLKSAGGKRILGASINTQLAPVFNAFGYERKLNPDRLGGAIFSIAGLQGKLKQFAQQIPPREKLYFVKLDIQSCFDTIPQAELMKVVDNILTQSQYRTTRYTELKRSEGSNNKLCKQKFGGLAQFANDEAVLSLANATDLVSGKDGAVLVEGYMQKVWQHRQLISLLREHVLKNIVKIGKKHYQQTTGIPQGSVLSSALCTFFYSEFEKNCLGFLLPASSLLIRLIDDFLLITTDKAQAVEFLRVMLRGSQAYGITVNQNKTLANFDVQVGGQKIPRADQRRGFPYCGLLLDTKSLEIAKDWRRKDQIVDNGITVDVKKRAVNTFRRKTVLSFKMQMQAMLLDATLNSPDRVQSTYMEAFEETVTKMHAYARNMPPRLRPSGAIVQGVLAELIKVASRLGQRRQPRLQDGQLQNPVSRAQITWIGAMAFERVLLPKQTDYRHVLLWLRSLRRSETRTGSNHRTLRRFVQSHDCVLDRSVY